MLIDRIVPTGLNQDKHPLDLVEGEIYDAINMSIADYGGEGDGLYKVVKGNLAVNFSSLPTDSSQKVVGSVADYQRNHIYFFVKSNTSTNNAIYRYSSDENAVVKVIGGSFLALGDFVKANIVNIVNQHVDETVEELEEQCMLFFTDGVNPPRRINVDRAIRGEFATYDTDNLSYMISACKAAPNVIPTVFFDTDPDYKANNFARNMFQFAVQYLYKDGDESAISGYSTIAVNDFTYLEGIDTALLPVPKVDKYENNVCVIEISRMPMEGVSVSPINTIPATLNIFEINKVRILARNGNSGAFFVVDEVYIDQDEFRLMPGSGSSSPKKIYDSIRRQYRFYNEGLYEYSSSLDTDKLYDNVPFTAVGQCVADDRVMYSNYTETYPNVDVTGTITPIYSDYNLLSTSDIFYDITQNPTQNIVSIASGSRNITVNMTANPGGFTALNTVIPAGSKYRLSFMFRPQGSFYSTLSNQTPLKLKMEDSSGDQFELWVDSTTSMNPVFTEADQSLERNVDIYVNIDEDTTVADLKDILISRLLSTQIKYNSDMGSSGLNGGPHQFLVAGSLSSDFAVGDLVSFSYINQRIQYTWGFSVTSTPNSNLITITPELVDAKIIRTATNAIYTSNEYRVFKGQLNYDVKITGQLFNKNYVNYTGYETIIPQNSSFTYVISALQTNLRAVRSFKAGSTHELGVVYYDKFNRSGYVNILGSAYVDYFGSSARATKNGPCALKVNISSAPPSWAERFQIVYSGPSTIDSFTTYTTGGAYPKRIKDGSSYNVDTKSKLIYVSLNTLEKFMAEKGANKTYSFTPGDKLRVVTYNSTTDGTNGSPFATVTSTAINGAFGGRIVEFDVVGFEVLGTDSATNPITDSSTVNEKYTGDFVILSAPDVESGMYKYVGWDWYSVTGNTYPNNDSSTQLSYWGRESVVEIYSPAKNTEQKTYYEIGKSYPFILDKNGAVVHPNVVVSEGTCHFRPSMCKTASYSYLWQEVGSIKEWVYKLKFIESSSANDLFSSNSWSRGRSMVRYEKARTIREKSGIIYSDKYNRDSERLTLSSFNPITANFASTNIEYGSLNYIESLGENLIAIQENKTSIAGLSRNVVSYADGSESVAVSTNVIGQFRYLSGDFGCGNKPSSVLKFNNNVFYVDPDKKKVVRFSTDQAYIISDVGMKSFFDSKINKNSSIVSGYDPEENMYMLTIGSDTIGYSLDTSKWISRYTFTPDCYNYIDNKFISFRYSVNYSTQQRNIFWIHSELSATRASFYGSPPNTYSSLTVVSNMAPANVKVYNSMSILGSGWNPYGSGDDNPALNVEGLLPNSNIMRITTDLNSFALFHAPEKKEGTWYYKLKTSRKSDFVSNKLIYNGGDFDFIMSPSSSNITKLPRIDSTNTDGLVGQGKTRLVFSGSIKRKGIKINDYIFRYTNGNYEPLSNPDSLEGSRVTNLESETTVLVNNNNGTSSYSIGSDNIYCVSNWDQDGDSVRGRYAKAHIKIAPGNACQINAINFHISDSKLHHSSSENP